MKNIFILVLLLSCFIGQASAESKAVKIEIFSKTMGTPAEWTLVKNVITANLESLDAFRTLNRGDDGGGIYCLDIFEDYESRILNALLAIPINRNNTWYEVTSVLKCN